jgi:site-specific recombinase XerD
MPSDCYFSSPPSASAGPLPNWLWKTWMSPFCSSSSNLEVDRGNCIRKRNNRLSAIHAFFRYVAISEPALALDCRRVLAIPSKRYERGPVEFLTEEETAALVASPNPGTWIGRRDKALLLVAVQTGLRNSEITSLCREDVEFGTGAHVRCLGKVERCAARDYGRLSPRF